MTTSSEKAWDERSWTYAKQYIDIPEKASRLETAARYWLEWNRLAEVHAIKQFRIEDLNPRLLVHHLGVESLLKGG